jgi:hypothetical protein
VRTAIVTPAAYERAYSNTPVVLGPMTHPASPNPAQRAVAMAACSGGAPPGAAAFADGPSSRPTSFTIGSGPDPIATSSLVASAPPVFRPVPAFPPRRPCDGMRYTLRRFKRELEAGLAPKLFVKSLSGTARVRLATASTSVLRRGTSRAAPHYKIRVAHRRSTAPQCQRAVCVKLLHSAGSVGLVG